VKRLRKLLATPARDLQLLLRAWLLVAAVRLGLTLASYRAVRRVLQKIMPPARKGQPDPADTPAIIRNCVWAVHVASHYVPAATCLTQAIALQALLTRRGQEASLHIGVARDDKGQFEAHAWVESGGRVIIGGSRESTQRFTPIAAFDTF
jgi:hypothetical protein